MCIYTYLFLIQEWESNEGATGGNSSGPRVGTTIVKNIIILCLFKENNNIHSYCHRLSQHYMIILCSRDTKHINYFVIARTLLGVYFFVFVWNKPKVPYSARITLKRIICLRSEFKEVYYIIRLSVLHNILYTHIVYYYIHIYYIVPDI